MKSHAAGFVSCAMVLYAAGLAHGDTYWNLIETTGGIAVGGSTTLIANHNSGPVTCDLKPDWDFDNGGGLSDAFIISEDGGLNGVYLYASVQYDIASSAGQSPMFLEATRTIEARVGTIEGGVQTTNVPDIPFLQSFLPNTPFSGSADASFNFQAFQCCPTCPVSVDCDQIEVDLGGGFETVCGEFTGECFTRWLSGAAGVSALFEWDPSGNGGLGSLFVDAPISLSDTALIMPAPSSAALTMLAFGLAARRRRSA
jgi:hypothetical protein